MGLIWRAWMGQAWMGHIWRAWMGKTWVGHIWRAWMGKAWMGQIWRAWMGQAWMGQIWRAWMGQAWNPPGTSGQWKRTNRNCSRCLIEGHDRVMHSQDFNLQKFGV